MRNFYLIFTGTRRAGMVLNIYVRIALEEDIIIA